MTNFEEWLDRATDGASQRSIAAALDEPNTSVSRWVRTGKIPADQVINIARHYGASILDGLHAAGYMTDEEVATERTPIPLAAYSATELAEDLARRLGGRTVHTFPTTRDIGDGVPHVAVKK